MTDQHLIDAPSNELIDAWADKYEGHMPEWILRHVANEAAQWGADQQLTKDATWLDHNSLDTPHLKITPIGKTLIEAMRPKLPSLKQQAFEALSIAVVENEETFSPAVKRLICKALEELPND